MSDLSVPADLAPADLVTISSRVSYQPTTAAAAMASGMTMSAMSTIDRTVKPQPPQPPTRSINTHTNPNLNQLSRAPLRKATMPATNCNYIDVVSTPISDENKDKQKHWNPERFNWVSCDMEKKTDGIPNRITVRPGGAGRILDQYARVKTEEAGINKPYVGRASGNPSQYASQINGTSAMPWRYVQAEDEEGITLTDNELYHSTIMQHTARKPNK